MNFRAQLHTVTRVLMLIVAAALGAVFTVPLWHIQLEAPQYPEGLGMGIWINRLSGDLNTINGLNHYIGMQEIHAASFAELKYMPIIVGFFILGAVLTALINQRWALTVWFGLLGFGGLLGLWDFWRWTYDYGHNLNPYAAIKVPGMTYQPPVFGSKTLLNFKAHSFPDTGGWILIGVGMLVLGLLVWEFLAKPKTSSRVKQSKQILSTAVLLTLMPMTIACQPQTDPIVFNQESCHFCKMTISDRKYGAELVTKTGKVYKYDSSECLVRHLHQDKELYAKKHSLWVIDAGQPGTLIPAEKAFFVYSLNLPSPMGAFLTALKESEQANTLLKSNPGQVLSWEDVMKKLKKSESHAAHGASHG